MASEAKTMSARRTRAGIAPQRRGFTLLSGSSLTIVT